MRGQYSTHRSKMTLGHESGLRGCLETEYTWTRVGKKLTFTKISDAADCAGRTLVLTHGFKAV